MADKQITVTMHVDMDGFKEAVREFACHWVREHATVTTAPERDS